MLSIQLSSQISFLIPLKSDQLWISYNLIISVFYLEEDEDSLH